MVPENRKETGKLLFQSGQSGNPGGRPKKGPEQRQLEEMCRDKTPEALTTILEIMSGGENERNKLSAAQYVLDRGWGKPAQEIKGSLGVEVSIADAIRAAAAARGA